MNAPTELDDPVAVLARNGRTFRFAGRLLGRPTMLRAARLYRFCRWLDDLVDETAEEATGEETRARLDQVRSEVRTGEARDSWTGDFLDLCGECDLSPTPVFDLLAGLERDLGRVRIQDLEDLTRYAYQVAGTVGLWMHGILGAAHKESQRHAVDLGIAMQISNICRDVHEDARRDRVYLPPEWTDSALTPRQILGSDPFVAGRIVRARSAAVACAERYYRSAEVGLKDLPLRNRVAIATAARAYGAIGHEAARLRPGRSDERARVGRFGKLRAAAGALVFAVGSGSFDPNSDPDAIWTPADQTRAEVRPPTRKPA